MHTPQENEADPPRGIEEQLRDMLKRAGASFGTDMSAVQPGPGDGPPPEPAPEPGAGARLKAIREFSLKPRDIRDYLDRFVIRQDEAKKVLSVAICDHYNHVRACVEDPAVREQEHAKHNVILLGPTGVGKTYLIRCVAKLIGVPFVKADATKFSETGYVGHDVEDLVRDLVKAADGDADLAQYGIIFLDEVDKIASASNLTGRDVSGRGVQVNLLKLMEETDVSLFSQTDLLGQMQAVMDMQRGKAQGPRTLNTRHILFIVSGAFDKLGEQVRRRVGVSGIGFSHEHDRPVRDEDYLRQMQTRDLVDYGFEPEFVGRLPIRVVCEPLDAGDLERILDDAEGNILTQYRADLAGYGIEFSLTREALRRVAEKAHAEGTGARGLMTVLERVFRPFKFDLPSTAIRFFELTRETVEDPDRALKSLLKQKEVARHESMLQDLAAWAARFEREHGIHLEFDDEAAQLLLDAAIDADRTIRMVCEDRFHDLGYGLKLAARTSGLAAYRVDRAMVENPAQELSRLVAAGYRANAGGEGTRGVP